MKTTPQTPYTLKDWEVKVLGGNINMTGKVFGHPQYEDATDVVTSPVVCFEGRTAFTASGSAYQVDGDPTEEIRDLLESSDAPDTLSSVFRVIRNFTPTHISELPEHTFG